MRLSKCTFIYLFPSCVSLPLSFFMLWTQKKRERVCAGPVLYKPVLFSCGVIKKATLNRTSLREEKGQILKSLFFSPWSPLFPLLSFFCISPELLLHFGPSPVIRVALKLYLCMCRLYLNCCFCVVCMPWQRRDAVNENGVKIRVLPAI